MTVITGLNPHILGSGAQMVPICGDLQSYEQRTNHGDGSGSAIGCERKRQEDGTF